MNSLLRVMLPAALALVCLTSAAIAQDLTRVEQNIETLRAQLREVIAKEAELQTRIQQLDEDLKPENIQRSLAGIGTTRPDELREQRRLQLEKEKSSVRAQLDQLATSRTRLETAITTAEAEVDRLRTNAASTPPQTNTGGQSQAMRNVPEIAPAIKRSRRPARRQQAARRKSARGLPRRRPRL